MTQECTCAMCRADSRWHPIGLVTILEAVTVGVAFGFSAWLAAYFVWAGGAVVVRLGLGVPVFVAALTVGALVGLWISTTGRK